MPRSPPPWLMIVRNESVSLNECGVETCSHLPSSNATASAPLTSSRMNRQSGLKFNVARGDGGAAYRSAARADCSVVENAMKANARYQSRILDARFMWLDL